jgi:hypothetical protein
MSDVFEENPRFYSKNAIAVWTIILSPLLGCILFAYNLKAVGRGKLALLFVLAGIAWTVVIKKLTGSIFSNPLLQLMISNLLGSVLLTFLFWKILLGDNTEYKSRPVWKPVLIFTGICVLLLSINYFGLLRQ